MKTTEISRWQCPNRSGNGIPISPDKCDKIGCELLHPVTVDQEPTPVGYRCMQGPEGEIPTRKRESVYEYWKRQA